MTSSPVFGAEIKQVHILISLYNKCDIANTTTFRVYPKMMYIAGETGQPPLGTISLIESIVQNQVIEMVR